jgi:hypothetical protein
MTCPAGRSFWTGSCRSTVNSAAVRLRAASSTVSPSTTGTLIGHGPLQGPVESSSATRSPRGHSVFRSGSVPITPPCATTSSGFSISLTS